MHPCSTTAPLQDPSVYINRLRPPKTIEDLSDVVSFFSSGVAERGGPHWKNLHFPHVKNILPLFSFSLLLAIGATIVPHLHCLVLILRTHSL